MRYEAFQASVNDRSQVGEGGVEGRGRYDGLQETVDLPGGDQALCSGHGGLEELALIDCQDPSGHKVTKSSDGLLESGMAISERRSINHDRGVARKDLNGEW